MARFSRSDAKRNVKSDARRKTYRSTIRQRTRLRQMLRAARLLAAFSQTTAAQRLGQDQAFISKIESGKRQVEFVEVEHFAEIYNKPLSFFATAIQNASKHGKTKPKKIDRKKRRVR